MIKRTINWMLVLLTIVSVQATYAAQVNVYSARKEVLIKPILDAFTQQTGIQVKLLTGKADALLTRLRVEGAYSPADVFITVDAGRLHRAKVSNVLQPIQAEKWLHSVPAELRDDDNYWLGLTMRARPIMYAPDRVASSELSSYEDLASNKWQGRLCLRSSEAVYNQSLVAATLHALGEQATQAWLQGMVANLAIPPAGGDVDQIKNVAAGQCDVTLVNTYYLGRMVNSDSAEERAVAQQVKVFWPNQNDRGSHFNVSGAGITKFASNVKEAHALLAFLVSPEAQRWYADINNEYPVVAGVANSATLDAFGEAKRDPIALQILGENNTKAVQLMDQAGWR
ncbi:MAG: Fe(3+) ABC transporter substrate-binding protein [Gammaproteobacteria bacterium]|jgi:iron(III) transport system substrate-binding protein|nr:Fe(3+) ABC transporter substrate-binding protein [Gammaproteobacteria bacterium]